METPQIYSLRKRKRLLNFPFRLAEIGWMPRHICSHRNAVIPNFFICISSDVLSSSERIVDGVVRSSPARATPSLGFVFPGTRIHTLRAAMHDELFFVYPPEMVPRFREMFGELKSFLFSWMPHELILELRRELKNLEQPGTADRLDQLAIRIISEIMLLRNETLRDENTLALRIHTIAASLTRGKSLRDVLAVQGMSERSFYRAWSQVFSVSPHQYVLKFRLDEARRLLCETDLPLAEIAERCGFSSLSYFHQVFRDRLELTPRGYRNRHRTHLFTEGSVQNSSSRDKNA